MIVAEEGSSEEYREMGRNKTNEVRSTYRDRGEERKKERKT
jgi:hypothetical protein